MASLKGIDMNGVEAETPRGALPPGDYQAVITDSELKPTKNGGGQYLELVLQVQEGPYKGRKVWDRLNLFNSNQTAVVIAKQRLKAIYDATGIQNPGDSQQLHNRLLTMTVDVREYEGRESNEVKGYAAKRASGQPVAQQPAAASMANPFG